MRGLRGFALGVFGLIVLQASLHYEQSGKNKPSGLLEAMRQGLDRALNPDIPAVPDLRAGGSSPGASGATYAGQAVAKTAAKVKLARKVVDPSIIRKRKGA